MRRVWVRVDGAEISFSALEAAALMARHHQGIGNTKYAQEDFRRFCAANMSKTDFTRYAWRKSKALHNYRESMKKLHGARLVDKQLHMTELGVTFVKQMNEQMKPRVSFSEFRALTTSIYTKKSGRFAA